MKIRLERNNHTDKQVTGRMFVYNDSNELILSLYTLELAWKDNERRVSCIPAMIYNVIKHKSPKFGDSFWIQNVPDRSEILIHIGNYAYIKTYITSVKK